MVLRTPSGAWQTRIRRPVTCSRVPSGTMSCKRSSFLWMTSKTHRSVFSHLVHSLDLLKELRHIGVSNVSCLRWSSRLLTCMLRAVSIGVSRLWNCSATTSASARCWRTSLRQQAALPVEPRRKADRPRTRRPQPQCRQQLARLPAACFQSTSCPLRSRPSTGKLAKSADFHTIYCYFRYNETITWHTANILTLTFWSVSGTFVIQRIDNKRRRKLQIVCTKFHLLAVRRVT